MARDGLAGKGDRPAETRYLRVLCGLAVLFCGVTMAVAWGAGLDLDRWPVMAPLRNSVIALLSASIWLYGVIFMPRRVRGQLLISLVPAGLIWYGLSAVPALAFMRSNHYGPLAIATFMTLGLVYVHRRRIPFGRLATVVDLLLVLLCVWATFVLLGLTMLMTPVYDFYLLSFEKTAGLLGVRHFVDAFDDPGLVRNVLTLFYMALAPLLCALIVEERLRGQVTSYALVHFLATVTGYTLYYLLPAVGPLEALPDYPVYPDVIQPVMFWPLDPHFAPRNAWPSLHTTWALFLIYRAFLLPPVSRTFYIIAGSGIIVATLVLHMHWITDLFAAVPLSVLIYSLSRQIPGQRVERCWIVELVCFLLLVAWLALLRGDPLLFDGHMWLARAFIGSTITLPVVGLWWLRQPDLSRATPAP